MGTVGAARPDAGRLVGREEELGRLRSLLAAARSGRSEVAVVSGPAGIGKTSLLRAQLGDADGLATIVVDGVEQEAGLPYGALHRLASPLLPLEDALPDPQHQALEVVFGRRAGPAPDPFLVGLATLTVLTDHAARRPLVCVVDDAHWVDDASLGALAFAARRLLADPIALVFATRPEPRALGHLAGLPQVTLGPLDRAAQLALLEQHVAGIPPPMAGRMVTESEGNPLALVEYARHGARAEDVGPAHPADPQPLTAKVERLFDAEIAALPQDARLLLLTAALEPSRDGTLVRRAAERLGVDFTRGPERELGRLATIEARVTFAHPLVPSAAHRLATSHERRLVHAALAAMQLDGDALARAWHLSHATDSPDDAVADELEGAATLSDSRGGYAAASVLLHRAAELSTAPAARDRRLVGSAEAAVLASEFGRAESLVTEERRFVDPGLAARAALVRGKAKHGMGAYVDAATELAIAAALLQDVDAAAARDAWQYALYAAWVGDGTTTPVLFDVIARQALDAGLGLEHRRTLVDLLVLGLVHVRVGDRAVGLRLLTDAFASPRVDSGQALALATVLNSVAAVEAFDRIGGHRCLDRQMAQAPNDGSLIRLKPGLRAQAVFLAHEGRIAEAERRMSEAEELDRAVGTDPRWVRGGLLIPQAMRGRDGKVMAEGAELIERATDLGSGSVVASTNLARAEWLNARSCFPEAAAELERVVAVDAVGWGTWALPTYVEAAVRSGDQTSARRALARLRERASPAGTPWAEGLLARSHALLAAPDDAGPLFRRALDHLHRSGMRVDHARAQLLYGEWLRRERRISEAIEQLGAAHDALATMGVEGYAGRARAELAAAGGRVRRHVAPETRDQLTAREHQVATRAAAGATNREVATQMFISEATVAYHLRKVFQKLEITSRRELRTAL